MIVLDVLKCASLYLNLEKEFEPFFDDESLITPSEETQREYDKLLKAFNLVLQKIASDYIPILKTEYVEVIDNKIDLSGLSENISQIYKLSSNGKNLKYKLFEGFIAINFSGFLDVEYGYVPDDLLDSDDFDLFCGKVSLFTLSMGVASEYCYLSGFFEDAKIWDTRFKEGLLASNRKRSLIKMPKRRWF